MSEPERSPPQSTVQAAGQAATDVINGLKQQPTLLAVVVLNVIALGFACWFLGKLADATTARTAQMMQMIQDCIRERHST